MFLKEFVEKNGEKSADDKTQAILGRLPTMYINEGEKGTWTLSISALTHSCHFSLISQTSPYFPWREKSLLPKFEGQLGPCH